MRWTVVLLLCAALAACGDLPQPFAGRPGRQALLLSRPPPPRLAVPAPPDALLPDPEAALWASRTADALVAAEVPAVAARAHRGDWQLALTATMAGDMVTPRYTVLDPKGAAHGNVVGAPVPAAAWASGDSGVLAEQAQAAAPQLVDLLTAVEAQIRQSDPNSLLNRPARVFLAEVTGAPGDGDVAQGHDLPRGTLDGHWGDIADVVTTEAADGVHRVIANWSGGAHKAK